MLTAFIIGLLSVVALAIVKILRMTIKWVSDRIKERLAARENHKVIFADMRETVDTITREQKSKQTEYSMDELEKMCQESPFVFADYDIATGEVNNYTGINAHEVDPEIKKKLRERGGMVVFDG